MLYFFVDNHHLEVNKYFKMKEGPKDKFVLVVTYICQGLICKTIKYNYDICSFFFPIPLWS
jgi:hypothetical protein